MIIAIPVDENKSDICLSFARSPYFLFFNTLNLNKDYLLNPASTAQGGAGIKAAQFILDNNANAVITFRCGENAANILKQAEIKIYKATQTDVVSNLENFKNGNTQLLTHFHAGFQGKQ